MATVTSYTSTKIDELTDGAFTGGYLGAGGAIILVAQDSTEVTIGAVMDGVPVASDTVAGVAEYATEQETIDGYATHRTVTPATLAAVIAGLSAKYPTVFLHNGTSYAESSGDVYIGPVDPGPVSNGCIWFDTAGS